jgi:neutral ceramidase
MLAGFARRTINPPPGTRMLGWLDRDCKGEATGTHDDLCVRALYLRRDDEAALILAYDVVFFSREHADRLKAAVGRALDLLPRQILINCSHTHAGPSVATFGHHYDTAPDWAYLELIERETLAAAADARASARPATLHAGAGHTALPVSRRRLDASGTAQWAPDPDATVCHHLPVCLLRDDAGAPVCLLFSVSCHPSTVYGWEFSADYPGPACDRLDAYLGAPAAMFLQGFGGDTKAATIAETDPANPHWRGGTHADVEAAGEQVTREVIAVLDAGLTAVVPALRTALIEQHYPLAPLPPRAVYEDAITSEVLLRRLWGERQLRLLDRGLPLPVAAPILLHGITLGEGLRLVAIEGEPVGELALHLLARFPAGVTLPLGYSNGMGLYLPTSRMLPEGGYEVESYYEYGFPAPLAPGIEDVLDAGLAALRRCGIT